MRERPILFADKSDCCGCAACEAICPQKCILMIKDKQGFYYPEIKYEQCISCFRCIKVCPLK